MPNPVTQPRPPIPAGGTLNLPGGSGGAAGTNFGVVGPPNAYPAFGTQALGRPLLGADAYDRPTAGVKRHFGTVVIAWIDAPSVLVPAAVPGARHRAEFVSFVRGAGALAADTCWCHIRIDHSWTRAGGRVGGPTITRVDGRNCNVF